MASPHPSLSLSSSTFRPVVTATRLATVAASGLLVAWAVRVLEGTWLAGIVAGASFVLCAVLVLHLLVGRSADPRFLERQRLVHRARFLVYRIVDRRP